jgi:transposase
MAGTRWTLDAIHQVCDWLRLTTTGGVWRLLDRLDLSWKGSRWHVHSPDLDYDAKRAHVHALVQAVRASAGSLALVYLDEVTFYRQPSLAHAWEERGAVQPLAERRHRSNTPTRVLASLDVLDARIRFRRRSEIGVAELVGFYQDLTHAYPEAQTIYVVQDNWPVHVHPDVLVALQPQTRLWPFHRPASWSSEPSATAQRKWGDLHLPIQIVQLPTYASWTNPIEKLWRKLKADVLHLHRHADTLDALRQEVDHFLEQFAHGSLALLRYVGLFVPS